MRRLLAEGDETLPCAMPLEEALAAVDAALRLRPNDLNAIIKHGLCFQSLGALHDAYNAYDSVIRVQPNHPLACRALGTLFQVRSLF